MDAGNTLLAHLSARFTRRTEDIAVEALGHILASSEGARNGLHDVLRNGGLKDGDIGFVATQSTGKEGERPDLACHIGGEERVLIEAKFWAPLTSNQPVTYLKRLMDNNKPSALLFVAPEAGFVRLWTALQRRIEDAQDESITLGESSLEDGVRAAPTGGEHMLMMTSWETLLKHMESRAKEAEDGAAQNDIQQLRGLAVREDWETLLPMRSEQLGPEFPRFVTHINQLVNDAIRKAREENLIDKNKRSQKAPDENGYARNISLLPLQELLPDANGKKWEQRFGVNFTLWRDFGETPLWLTARRSWQNWDVLSKKLHAQQSKQSDPIHFVDKECAIPIYLRMGVEYEAVLDDVVKQIKALSDMLRDDPA